MVANVIAAGVPSVVGMDAVRGSVTFRYGAPLITSVAPAHVGTAGGDVVMVTGSNFAVTPPLSATVKFARLASSSTCDVINATSTLIQCVSPIGAGTLWRVVVTNNDPGNDTTPSNAVVPATSQASPTTGASVTISYRPPVVIAIRSLTGAFPAVGGFVLVVVGTDLTAAPKVTVGGEPCPLTVVANVTVPHTVVTCSAPPMRTDGPSSLAVDAGGQLLSESGITVPYDGPVVLAVVPNVLDARDAGSRSQLTIAGQNFGVPVVGGVAMPPNVSVAVGHVPCGNVLWQSDGALACSLSGVFTVGVYHVEVVVRGVSSALGPLSVVELTCTAGYYTDAAGLCQPCALGGYCPGGLLPPVALEGYYPTDLGAFVLCTPPDACLGGVNGTCSELYTGVRCATCNIGAYR